MFYPFLKFSQWVDIDGVLIPNYPRDQSKYNSWWYWMIAVKIIKHIAETVRHCVLANLSYKQIIFCSLLWYGAPMAWKAQRIISDCDERIVLTYMDQILCEITRD